MPCLCSNVIISVVGDHAGESANKFFSRKMDDISRTGITYWLMNSRLIKPEHVCNLCSKEDVYAIFIDAASAGGARPTTPAIPARQYSINVVLWKNLPGNLSPVSGKLSRSTTALTFDWMDLVNNEKIDLWKYACFPDTDIPVRFIMGASTTCAVRHDMLHHEKRTCSRYRRILAVAHLVCPWCVWLR